jgi:hypothetical protein
MEWLSQVINVPFTSFGFALWQWLVGGVLGVTVGVIAFWPKGDTTRTDVREP